MHKPEPDTIARLLAESAGGDGHAANRLQELLAGELHDLARACMRDQRAGHTLQTTALVNEAYLRLVRVDDSSWASRAQFLTLAAKAMRSVLVDHARGRMARKRGGDWVRTALDSSAAAVGNDDDAIGEVIAVDEALTKLADFDERKARVVELRFYGGLEIEETARVLDISPATVKREWRLAKAWLRREIEASLP